MVEWLLCSLTALLRIKEFEVLVARVLQLMLEAFLVEPDHNSDLELIKVAFKLWLRQ